MTDHPEATHHDNSKGKERSWFSGQRAMLFSLKRSTTKPSKIMLLGALSIVFSIAAWGLVSRLLSSPSFSLAGGWWILVVTFLSFFLLIIFLGLVGVLVHDHIEELGILALSAAGYAFWFHRGAFAVITMLLLFLGGAYFSKSIRSEEGEYVRFSLSRVFEHAQGIMIAMMLLAVSITSYGVTAQRDSDLHLTQIDRIGSFLGSATNQSLGLVVKGYHADESVNMFLLRVAVMVGTQKNQGAVNPQVVVGEAGDIDLAFLYSQLPADIVERLKGGQEIPPDVFNEEVNIEIMKQLDTARAEILKKLHVADDPTITIGEVVQKAITQQLTTRFGNYAHFIPPLFGLTVFVVLSSIGFLYSFCIARLANLVFWILRRTGFVHVQRVSASVEVVTLNPSANT